jgi:hypothetical protein
VAGGVNVVVRRPRFVNTHWFVIAFGFEKTMLCDARKSGRRSVMRAAGPVQCEK